MILNDDKISILVVDDDMVDREMIRRLLSKSNANYTITEAKSVDEGLILYGNKHFDVILLDYRMPRKNGIEMIIEIRTHTRNYGSAIVMLSSAEDNKLAIECIKAGAQDFIPKSEVTTRRIQSAIIQARTRFELERELRESYLDAKSLAEKDALTGLANRYVFDEALQLAVASNGRAEFKVGLIILDIDNFKHINDIHGHDAGDSILINVANRISESLRENEFLSRIGGDEFAIMITNLDDMYHLHIIAERVIESMKEPFHTEHAHCNIELSIGIAAHPDNSIDSKELIKCSDIALYRAKTVRGNQIRFFYPEMQEKLVRRYNLDKVLNSAVKEKNLNLLYQPVIDANTLRLIGFEALLRLDTHSEIKSFPDEFIPISEQIGAIIDIGAWVIDNSIRQLALWNNKSESNLSMAINLSALQLENDGIIKTIENSLEKYDIAASRIEFEITETAFLNSDDIIVSKLKAIYDMGCKIALDDFGTGYSSISHLLMFPITTIKLDKSIMPKSINDTNSLILLDALIVMSHKLKLEIVAEGIEEQFQLDFIQKQNVHRAQGYLFMKPALPSDIEKAYFD